MPEIESPGRIKITEIKSIPLRVVEEVGEITPAWSPDRPMPIQIGGGSFVEIHTDQGIVGIGPAVSEAFLPAIRSYLVGNTVSSTFCFRNTPEQGPLCGRVRF